MLIRCVLSASVRDSGAVDSGDLGERLAKEDPVREDRDPIQLERLRGERHHHAWDFGVLRLEGAKAGQVGSGHVGLGLDLDRNRSPQSTQRTQRINTLITSEFPFSIVRFGTSVKRQCIRIRIVIPAIC